MGRAATILVSALVAATLAPGDSAAYEFYFADSGEPMRWFRTETDYRISTVPPGEIPASEVRGLVELSFDQWLDLPGCAVPDIAYAGTTDVAERTLPAGLSAPPDNVIVFIRSRQAWAEKGFSPTWIALTSIGHNTQTGEIVDADIEINDGGFAFSTIDVAPAGAVDFRSMLTHEIGHFIGLFHSDIPEATMFASYAQNPENRLQARTLHPDDVQGACDLYVDVPPPGSGLLDDGSCAAAGGGATLPGLVLVALALARALVSRRRG